MIEKLTEGFLEITAIISGVPISILKGKFSDKYISACEKRDSKINKTNPNIYNCDLCGEDFEKGWSDKEAIEEKEMIFPGIPLSECAVICDDCFKMVGLGKL